MIDQHGKPKYRCPECGSSKTVWLGFYMTKKAGKKHKRKCNRCGTCWTPRAKKVEVQSTEEQV